ncbi:MAG TPA: rod shape-determining protein MreC [Candidatus Alectryocaccobium stercorigallinarum]|nr:rod shape-determining protein MreC [Candidatus Alectryocaccobium stercorigallinarum]
MDKNKKFQIKNRNTLIILTIICISAIALTVSDLVPTAPVKEAASVFVVPFQKGINSIGGWFKGVSDSLKSSDELNQRIDELEEEVASLEEENLLLARGQQELQRLRELYDTDTSYAQYEKVAANVISKDPGNWYSSFIIDKGSNDGIEVDMNVIAAGGLVGLVTEVGSNWASVRTIIDDSSSVSAMTVTTEDTCIVNGDLTLIDEGLLYFDQMNTQENVVAGEQIVTSHISDKYLPGILIGNIYEINEDSNHLTKTGYILPAVDFSSIQEVLVIKELKQTVDVEENAG